jgi:hypothetical protein
MELVLDLEELGSGPIHANHEVGCGTEEFCLGNSLSIPVWCYHLSDLPLPADESSGEREIRELGQRGMG